MAITTINIGTAANDNTGDTGRAAFGITNDNFIDVQNQIDGKVDVDGAKVLSDNNYDNTDKAKVDNLPADVNADLDTKVNLAGDTMDVGSQFIVADGVFSAPSVVYGFETGDLTGFTTFGNANWFATSVLANTGTWSAQSGAIGNSQQTVLEKVETITNPFSVISFAYQTETEGDQYDPLEFYINGLRQFEVSGDSSGFKATKNFYIEEGTHTLTWKFTRDSGGGGGGNFVRIDDVSIRTFTSGLTSNSFAYFKDIVLDGNITLGGKIVGDPTFLSDIRIAPTQASENDLVFFIGTGPGFRNARFGGNALVSLLDLFENNANAAFGNGAGGAMTNGKRNTFLGQAALGGLVTGDGNVSAGYISGLDVTSGDNNVLLGQYAAKGVTTMNNSVVLMPQTDASSELLGVTLNSVAVVGPLDYIGIQIDGITGHHTVPNLTNANILTAGDTSLLNKKYADDFLEDPETVNILSEADFEPLELATDGVMRHPITYEVFTKISQADITVANPFWIKPSTTRKKIVFGSNNLGFQITYTGTDTLFYGTDISIFELNSIGFVFSNPGTRFLDLTGDFINNPSSSPVFRAVGLTVNGCDFGSVNNTFGIQIMNLSLIEITKGLRINNAIIGVEVVDSSMSSNTAIDGAYFTLTGIVGNIFVNSLSISSLVSGESLIAADSGLITDEASITLAPFLGTAGTEFFQSELSGDIVSYVDLAVQITGSGTSYVDDGNGNVKVTVSSTFKLYEGLTITNSATTSYNGDAKVLKVLSTTEFVMVKTYVGDEVSGTYVGNGTRVTTEFNHGITDFRVSTISGSSITEYNGAQIVRNSGGDDGFTFLKDYDIDVPFNGTAFTGSFSVTSFDQTNVKVLSRDNGALPDSQKVAQVYLNTLETVTIVSTVFSKIGGTNWIEQISEEFTTDNTGRITYNGIHPQSFAIRIDGNIGKVGGGTDVIEMQVAVNDVVLAASSASTEATISSGVSGEVVVTLDPGDYAEIWVTNQTNGSNIEVAFASLVIK